MSTEIRVFLATRLREERERLGLSQAQMAQLGGTKTRTYQDWERGLATVSTEFLVVAAAACSLDLMYVLKGVRIDNQAGDKSHGLNTFEKRSGSASSFSAVGDAGDHEILVNRDWGWQSITGSMSAWVAKRNIDKPEFQKAIHLAESFGISWTSSQEARADFALIPDQDSSNKQAETLLARLNNFSNIFSPSQYYLSVSKFVDLISAVPKRDRTALRNRFWHHFFGDNVPDSVGAVYRLKFVSRDVQEERLFRLSHAAMGQRSSLFLAGHWESSGEVVELSTSFIDGEMLLLGSDRLIAPDYLAKQMLGLTAPTSHSATQELAMREVTPEQAALLDNYENADEEGRDAARRVLVALSKSKTSKKAA
ncbi:helix-turn-helix transcriptional regulator [Comamonadaceae bacterium PP-2]